MLPISYLVFAVMPSTLSDVIIVMARLGMVQKSVVEYKGYYGRYDGNMHKVR